MPRKSVPSQCKCNTTILYWIDENDPNHDPNPGDDGASPVYGPCGAETRGGNFAPGHDAKLKGVLIKLHRQGAAFNFTEGSMLVGSDPMTEALKFGWGRFLTHQPKRRVRKSRSEGGVSESPQFPKAVVVKVGRWVYNGQVLSDGRVIYQDKKGNTLETTSDKIQKGGRK
jgi:hypothetical protein